MTALSFLYASKTFRQTRDTLQDALDHAEQGITILDQTSRFVAWNRTFETFYGFSKDTISVGLELDRLLSDQAQTGYDKPLRRKDLIALSDQALAEDHGLLRTTSVPGKRVLELRSNRLPNKGIITTYTDVTDTVAAEEALAEAKGTLESRVLERTQELQRTNADLAFAKAKAEEANLSKTRFLAAASHDILQPLNAAKLYSASLIERVADSPYAELAGNIDASLEAVEDILTTLLDMSRLDAGAFKIEQMAFPIDVILNQLQREFEPVVQAKGIGLRFVSGGLTVLSDRKLLRRLLQNLVSNAVKYTVSGRVLVCARRSGDTLKIEVWDTGIGIPPLKQNVVFQEFQRLDNGIRVAQGLGLGLSIVERIARVLSLPIGLSSQFGRGSKFWVEVPLASIPDVSVDAPSAPDALAIHMGNTPLSGVCILVLDNEPTILDGMRHLLKGWGCSVLTAESIEEAEACLQATPKVPNVTIADYHLNHNMTGLDGIKTLRLRLGADHPAILLTADRSEEVRQTARTEAVYLFNKPLKPASLKALLLQWRMTEVI